MKEPDIFAREKFLQQQVAQLTARLIELEAEAARLRARDGEYACLVATLEKQLEEWEQQRAQAKEYN